jgi:hypothetical protein
MGWLRECPRERVPLNQYIYAHLRHALNGYRNSRCGEYRPLLG